MGNFSDRLNPPWMKHAQNGDWDKAEVAAKMEDLGIPYRRMAKCIVQCDKAGIDLPQWCKDELLIWARAEVGDKERYLNSM